MHSLGWITELDTMQDLGDDLRSLGDRHSGPVKEEIPVRKRDVAVAYRPELLPPGMPFQDDLVPQCPLQVEAAGRHNQVLRVRGSKLLGVPAMVALFDAIGIGQWFRYVTGLVEVGSAIALLAPSVAVFGALALVATMVGAIVAHLFIVGGSPAMPAILLLGSAAVVWTRRHQVLGDRQTVR